VFVARPVLLDCFVPVGRVEHRADVSPLNEQVIRIPAVWQARVTRTWRFYFTIEGQEYHLHDMKPHPK
jgi:hypothetical protein